jgi:hypothetical protein
MLINKMPDKAAPVTLSLTSRSPVAAASVFRYSRADLKTIERLPDIAITAGRARMELPAYSITLLRCR